MKFREAVEKAIERWNGIWFHWGKSQQSSNAVVALRGILDTTIYDDELHKATMWLLGQSETPYSYKSAKLERLKKDSSLATFLDEELDKVKSQPNFKPQVSNSLTIEKKEQKKEKKVVRSSNKSMSYLSMLAKHQKEWSGIEITDIPTKTPGVYKYTENDKQTTNIKFTASIKLANKGVNYKEIVAQPEYWAELGRLVSKHRFGRCYSCAALVVYTLVADSSYDSLVIAVFGNEDYDHQFVVIGTMSEIKEGKGYAIDIWQANLDKKTPQVLPISECIYAKGNVKLACLLHPDDRASVRSFLS